DTARRGGRSGCVAGERAGDERRRAPGEVRLVDLRFGPEVLQVSGLQAEIDRLAVATVNVELGIEDVVLQAVLVLDLIAVYAEAAVREAHAREIALQRRDALAR